MNINIRLNQCLYDQVITDLCRPHPFSGERVGFLFGRIGSAQSANPLVLISDYVPIPDAQYIKDNSTGARISAVAIRGAMQRGLTRSEGVYHVHLHLHKGQPSFSRTDRRELPRLLPSFRAVSPTQAHGVILLSLDHGIATVWLPDSPVTQAASRISIVGSPIRFLGRTAI